MTTRLQHALGLWAGMLILGLLAIIPLAGPVRIVVALIVVCGVSLGWFLARRRAAHQRAGGLWADTVSLPPASFRRPVVLVCGDGMDSLFGTVVAERLALRHTDQGCYVCVPALEKLPDITESLLALRPQWHAQLSVMLVLNPCAHTDSGVLAGRLRTFRHQAAIARRQGTALPLMLVSYFQTRQGEDSWFCWANGEGSPRVRDAGACVSLTDWQLHAADSSVQATRMHACVQLSSAAAWLHEAVLPHLAIREATGPFGSVTICAIRQVSALPQVMHENLWRKWLRKRLVLTDNRQAVTDAALPFPDPLLNLIPLRVGPTSTQRASVVALWLFALAGAVALTSSAWQNTLLVRQVSDDLRRYTSIPESVPRRHGESALREDAMTVLRQTARRLDTYYRHGAPLALGLGLYRGEQLRGPLLTVIARHGGPAVPMLAQSEPVRLDSLSLFSPGSARLKPDSTRVLINALLGIKARPGWLIVIAGHTDATGDEWQNLQLSRARAAAVHEWMQHMGSIPDRCVAVQGFGASQPIASNDTEAGRAANRRVDIRLVPEEGACASPTAGPDTQPPVAFRDF
ncbi:OmpA family protein [Pseudomonas sp. RGM2987]|uniref:OmpA family protein n=1 Tax=Pseudomonas sp. RGM2987 TaxID=2930090 RepID=UPI001FD6D0C6|nr:OmpA family protein [Pseudomonas sp. RGM2987]MCJ8207128.1 OmpA family protein [Pseudomonas sp. RGM2987]